MSEQMILATRLIQTPWPPMLEVGAGNESFDNLVADIKEHGIRQPLTINLSWQVLDGNHRLAAVRHLGIEYVPVRVWTGSEYVE